MIAAILNALLWANATLVGGTAVCLLLRSRRLVKPQHGYDLWRAVLLAPALVLACGLFASSVASEHFVQSEPHVLPPVHSSMAVMHSSATTKSSRQQESLGLPGGVDSGTIAAVLFAVWALGLLYALGRLACDVTRACMIRRRSSPLAASSLGEFACRRATPRVTFRTSNEVRVPMVVGYRRPCVLFPKHLLKSLDPTALRQIAAHELMHAIMRDNWSLLAERFVAALLWCNPFAPFVRAEIAFHRERRCDEVGSQEAPASYINALLHVAETALRHNARNTVASTLTSGGLLTRRVAAMTSAEPDESLKRSCVLAAVVVVLVAGACATWTAPRIATWAHLTQRNASPDGRISLLSYLPGKWSCHAVGRDTVPIGTASFSAAPDGLVEHNVSIGGRRTFSSTSHWVAANGTLFIEAVDNYSRHYSTNSRGPVRASAPGGVVAFESQGYRGTLTMVGITRFESVSSVARAKRWVVVEDAVCDRQLDAAGSLALDTRLRYRSGANGVFILHKRLS